MDIFKMIAIFGAAGAVKQMIKRGVPSKRAEQGVQKALKTKGAPKKIAKLKESGKPVARPHIQKNADINAAQKRVEQKPRKKITEVSNQDSIEVSNRMTPNREKQQGLLTSGKKKAKFYEDEKKLLEKNEAAKKLQHETDFFDETVKVGTPEQIAHTDKAIGLANDRNILATKLKQQQKKKALDKKIKKYKGK